MGRDVVALWLAMTTGARRGELCAMQWDLLDLDRAVLGIRTSIAQDGTRSWEKDTKSHQQRRIALEGNTVSLLRAYRKQCEQDAAAIGTPIAPGGRIFSPSIDHATWAPTLFRFAPIRADVRPAWLGHELAPTPALFRYRTDRVGLDVRTVAGRLRHGQ